MARPLAVGMRDLLAGSFDIHEIVEIQDGYGAWQNLKTLGGVDWIDSGSWSQSLDQAVQSGTIVLRRDANAQSLAPLLAASPLNTITGAFRPLVYPSRRIRVKMAFMAKGIVPLAGDYIPQFDGKIDRVAFQDDPMTISISDIGAYMAATFIEAPTAYASAGGTAVETVMQSIDTDWMVDSLIGVETIQVPTSPGWNIRQYQQDYASVLQAIRDLAVNQIGWDFRYKWQSDDTFKPTFWTPDRSKTTPDWTFGPDEYFAVTTLEIADADIRNRITGSATDHATGSRITYTASDAGSILDFGVLYMAIQESSTSNIDSMTELQRMIDNALSDLSQPDADHAIATLFFYPVELGDLVRHTADGKRYDSDEDFAVVGITHSFGGGSGRTIITTRGKPAAAHKAWLNLSKPRYGDANSVPLDGITGADPGSVLVGGVDGNVTSVPGGGAGTAPVSDGAGGITFGNPTPGGTAGGDLSGTYPSPSVSKIDAVPVDLHTAAPTTGQLLVYNGTAIVPGSVGVAAKDEGTSLTTALASIDFVGAGVTATNIAGAVTVTIPGTVSLVTLPLTKYVTDGKRGVLVPTTGEVWLGNVNTGQIAIVNPQTMQVVRLGTAIGISAGNASYHLQWIPDGGTAGADRVWATVYSGGSNTQILIFNPYTRKVESQVTGGVGVLGIGYNPTNDLVYVSNSGANTVGVWDPRTSPPTSIAAAQAVGTLPHVLMPNPSDGTMWVWCRTSNRVDRLHPTTHAVTTNVVSGFNNPIGVAWMPDVSRFAVMDYGDGHILLVDPATNAITSNISTNIPSANSCEGIAYDWTNHKLALSYNNGSTVLYDNAGTRLQIVSTALITTDAVYCPSDGCFYCIRDTGNLISVIKGSTGAIVGTIPVGA